METAALEISNLAEIRLAAGNAQPVSLEEFSATLEQFQTKLFRLQTLDQYSVPGDDAGLKAFIDGEASQPEEIGREWRAFINASTQAGKEIANLHVVSEKLTPYMRYAIEWGYTANAAAGMDVKFINNSSSEAKKLVGLDYWLVDDKTVFVMDYAKDCKFVGARKIDDPKSVEMFTKLTQELNDQSITLKDFLKLYRAGRL